MAALKRTRRDGKVSSTLFVMLYKVERGRLEDPERHADSWSKGDVAETWCQFNLYCRWRNIYLETIQSPVNANVSFRIQKRISLLDPLFQQPRRHLSSEFGQIATFRVTRQSLLRVRRNKNTTNPSGSEYVFRLLRGKYCIGSLCQMSTSQ
jgi:hypothetical protein